MIELTQSDALEIKAKMHDVKVVQATLMGLMCRYLTAVMAPTVTLLEVHKLMYFQQEAG